MTCLVPWNGAEYDIDPLEFTSLEISLIKQRAGFTFTGLVEALAEFDGDAVRVLFWIVARRDDPDLKFSEFEGPSLKTFLPHIATLTEAIGDEMGKALPATSGSDGSPSSSDTPPTSTTG